HRINSGLSLACGWSLFVAILSSGVLLATTNSDINFGEAVFPLVVLCLQFALLPSALRGHRKVLLVCGEKTWPWTGLGVGLFATIPFLLIFTNLFRRERPHYEAAAVGSLRTISMAQTQYEHFHPETGFAISLEELRAAPGVDYIDPTLASGRKAKYT